MKTEVAPAVVVLGQNSLAVARQIIQVLPTATLYGLANRTTGVDFSFNNFGDTVRGLFIQRTPLIGICAAGILIRTLAPLLSDKQQEPPVLAVAEDGSAVVPLLGGLSGVNEIARHIAQALGVNPAITTTGDLRFHTTLLSPPPGYKLANPEAGKKFISDLLAGSQVRLEGTAPWLTNSQLPIHPDGELTIQITERSIKGQGAGGRERGEMTPDSGGAKGLSPPLLFSGSRSGAEPSPLLPAPTSNCLIYHPTTIAIGMGDTTPPEGEIRQLLGETELSPASVAGIFAPLSLAASPEIHTLSRNLGVPARFFPTTQLANLLSQGYTLAQAVALTATGVSGELISPSSPVAIALAPQPIDPTTIGQPRGRLAIIGTGPGGWQWMSPQVKEILHGATDLVGYKTYLDLIGVLGDGKQRHESDNRQETGRAMLALDLAAEGRYVAVVSSGDPGIYAMAAAVFEVLEQHGKPEWHTIEIQVAPGISAMQAAAAAIGAPLGHDFCAISLSDILKPWAMIEQRIAAAAEADFVIAFYNPVSQERTWQLAQARDILLRYRAPHTPVVVARNLGRPGQMVRVICLDQLIPDVADMRTVILVGSSQTRQFPRQDGGVWVYTPRRYSG
jgi:cobalt-precorrin 5A hydrolase/precorrin-3B C17-methyltransferase